MPLSQDLIFELADAATRSPAGRAGLLQGLPPGYIGLLVTNPTPKVQHVLDLGSLNRHPEIIGFDGPPLAQWLRNLTVFAQTPADRALITRALGALGIAPAPATPAPASEPPADVGLHSPRRVFISYTHAPAGHAQRVLALATQLRGHGVDVRLDQWSAAPDVHWPTWMREQVREADVILAVCNEPYKTRFEGRAPDLSPGGGVAYEAQQVSTMLMRSHGRGGKFAVVVFENADRAHIPLDLAGYSIYEHPTQYAGLYKLLTDQGPKPPPIGVLLRPDQLG